MFSHSHPWFNSPLVNHIQTWSTMNNKGKMITTVTHLHPWSKIINYSLSWETISDHNQQWSNMDKHGQHGQMCTLMVNHIEP